MATEVGSKVYRASGPLMWGLDGDGFYIEEGTLTQFAVKEGRRLIELQCGDVYVAVNKSWRATRAEALADVEAAMQTRAARARAMLAEQMAKEGGAA